MRSVVVVPTYMEALNVEEFIRAVRVEAPSAEILVVDDDSPDGTGEIAERVAADQGQTSVLHRAGKEGLGSAYRAGFAWAEERDFDVIVQMDCDFSHDPAMIPALVDPLLGGADCVIGSRYVPGGSTPNWPRYRKALSRYGNRYTAAMYGLDIRDATGGFRAYKAATLRDIEVATTRSNGYAFMSEIARRMTRAGMRIEEVPITFVDRERGTSKMSTRIIAESMMTVTVNGVQDHIRAARLGSPRRRN